MTIADELQKLINTKENIKNAIINKGIDVSDFDAFSSYPSKIDEITTGGNNENVTVELAKLNCACFGADVDSNGIASNFRQYKNNIGGIRLPVEGSSSEGTFGYFLNQEFNRDFGFQIRVETSSDLSVSNVVQGASKASYPNTGHNGVGISIKSNGTKLSIADGNFWKDYNYTFRPNTWYIIKVENVWNTSTNSMYIRTNISEDDGNTFTQLGYEPGELSYGKAFSAHLNYYQMGYVGGTSSYTLFAGRVDLTQTGYYSTVSDFVYWFAEIA